MAPRRSQLGPWLLGRRVVVRHRRPDGTVTDALGDLVDWRGGALTVATRQGDVRVEVEAVIAGKQVPEQALATAADAGILQLHRMSTLSWRPLEQEWLGGWLLRAGAGFTGRANSVLPLGASELDLPDAITAVATWYAARRIAPRFQLLPISGELDEFLDARGWPVGNGAFVLVADIAAVSVSPSPDLPTVTIEPEPSPEWLATYHYRGTAVPPSGVAVLRNHDHVGFASVRLDGSLVAVARGAVDDRWLGVAAVEVAPSARRRGLGRHVMAGLLSWAADEGARYVQLQVDVHNEPAQAMYAAMGFTEHHRYHYRSPA